MADKIKGSDLQVYIGTLPIGCDKTCTFEVTTKTVDTTSKCSIDANGFLQSENQVVMTMTKITGNGFTVYDVVASGGAPEFSTSHMLSSIFAQQKVYAVYKAGHGNLARYYGGDFFFTSVKETAAFDGVVTYDYELTQAGPIVAFPVS
jgi:predicted secreted protein